MRERATQITPTPADEALCAWLTERYSGDEYATRIQVCQWIGNQRGEVVFTHDQRVDPNDAKAKFAKLKLTRERLVEIGNKIVAAAQADCDALRRPTIYAVLAFHPTMSADSYARHLLRLAPKSALAVDADGVVSEDNVMSTKLLLGLLADTKRDQRWVMEQAMNVMSGAAERDAARIAALEGIQKESFERQAKLLAATEAALSTADERKIKREWNEMKMEGMRQGLATLRTLVPGVVAAVTQGRAGVMEGIKGFADSLNPDQRVRLFGRWRDADTQIAPGILDPEQTRLFDSIVAGRAEPPHIAKLLDSLRAEQFAAVQQVLTQEQFAGLASVAKAFQQSRPIYLSEGANEAAPVAEAPSAATSREQEIIGKLFRDAGEAGISIKLFGDWEMENGAARIVTPGIVTPDQVGVLFKVLKGQLPTSALDELLPGSGKPLAITSEQQAKAAEIMTANVAANLVELLGLRQRAAASGTA